MMELKQHINSSGNLDAVTSVMLKDGTKIQAPESSRIAFEDEPHLMLLSEWNLFDSMLCSSYIAPKLKTWSNNGLKKLKFLLARMGFPLVDCLEKFQFMRMDAKLKMKNEFEKFLPEYGITELYYRSFLRIHGYCSKESAADVVYGVTVLLESFVETKSETPAAEQFWDAYSALSSNNLDQLRKGMQNTIEIQRVIPKQCRIARHLGPPPGFGNGPSNKMADSFSQLVLNGQLPPIDDYRWLDGYQTPSTKGNGFNNFQNYNSHMHPQFATSNNNGFNDALSFPFPGKQSPMVPAEAVNVKKWQELNLPENLKLYSEQQLP